MIYLFDTDALILIIRSHHYTSKPDAAARAQRIVSRIKRVVERGHSAAISAISKAELEYGIAKSANPHKERNALEKILAPFDEYDFDAKLCARHYGELRAKLEESGNLIGAMDLLIAAHALALDAVLVSNNRAHSDRVPGLTVKSWSG